jgi:hypothetical protein
MATPGLDFNLSESWLNSPTKVDTFARSLCKLALLIFVIVVFASKIVAGARG